MSNLLDDLATLVAASGVGVYSPTEALPADTVPVTVNGWPPIDGPAVVVTLYPGPEPDTVAEYPRLQVRVRHHDALAAIDMERQAFDHLQHRGDEHLPGAGRRLRDCYALQSAPAPMGQDAQGRWEYARNYQLTTEHLED